MPMQNGFGRALMFWDASQDWAVEVLLQNAKANAEAALVIWQPEPS